MAPQKRKVTKKRPKKGAISINSWINIAAYKVEKLFIFIFMVSTMASVAFLCATRNISFEDGVFTTNLFANKLISTNVISLVVFLFSYAVAERKFAKKGILITIGICVINTIDAIKSGNGLVLTEFGGLTHISVLVSTIACLALISVCFCKKAR